MLDTMDKDTLFYEYYRQWVEIYKNGAMNISASVQYGKPQCRSTL